MKTALVTGGAARIGAQIVKTLHHNQFNIIIHCNQSKDKAQLLCDELNTIRANSVEIVSGNLNNIDELDSLVSSIMSIDLLVNLGVKRILSSGLGSNVELGMENLKAMVKYADNRIEIMPGGGINQNNIRKIISEVKPHAIHFSATKKHVLDEESRFSETILQVSREKAINLLETIKEGKLDTV